MGWAHSEKREWITFKMLAWENQMEEGLWGDQRKDGGTDMNKMGMLL